MTAFEAAIYAALANDATLAALAPGGVHRDVAPLGTTQRHVIFSWATISDRHTLASGFLEANLIVKAVEQGKDQTNVAAASDRAKTLVEALLVSGWNVMEIRREAPISFAEAEKDRVWQHVGARYRLWAQQS